MGKQVVRRRMGLCVAAAVVLTAGTAGRGAATKADIEKIRPLSVLTDEQLKQIDDFVAGQFNQMRGAREAPAVSQAAGDLTDTSQSRAAVAEGRLAYSDRYSAAVKQAYAGALARGAELKKDAATDKQLLGEQMQIAAALVVASCDNPLLREDLLKLAAENDAAVRYWGVRGLTTENVRKYLQADANQDPRQQVLQALNAGAGLDNPAIVAEQIAVAAAQFPGDEAADKVLQQCVAKRLEPYRTWEVRQEISDLGVLRAILSVAGQPWTPGNEGRRAALVRAAADLFSVAASRYIKGMQYVGPDNVRLVLLTDEDQTGLETLLIEGERLWADVMARRQPGELYPARFREAITQRNMNRVESAYLALLGPDGAANRMFRLYPAGEAGPAVLDAPADAIERARNMASRRDKLLKTD